MKIIITSLLRFLFAFRTGTAVHAQGGEWKTLDDEFNLLYRQGCYDRAVVVAKKALTFAEKNLGPDHPDVANSLNNLAELYRTQGDYAMAEPLFNRSLAIRAIKR